MNRLVASLLTLLGLTLATPAQAASGLLVGTLTFVNQSGQYCPSSQPCTGATYTQAQYGQPTGIPEAAVFLLDPLGNMLGGAPTNASGFYAIAWSTGANISAVPATLVILYVNASLRYQLKPIQSTYSAAGWYGSSAGVLLQNGTGLSNPQIFSTSVGENAPANVFWAGWKLWQSLKNSNRQLAYNTDVDVLAFDTNGAITGCDGSCARPRFRFATSPPAWAGQKLTVVLDGRMTTPYEPGIMMHELSHVADFVSAPNQGRVPANADNFGGASGHDIDTQEYTSMAFAEGLAHFFASTGFYLASANDPRGCGASGIAPLVEGRHCWGPATQVHKPFSIEQVGGPCVSGDGRKEMNALRFLWDLYDGRTGDDDSIFLNMYHVSDAIATAPCPSWPFCYGTNQLHDAWTSVSADINTATPNPSQMDANGTQWFQGLYQTAHGVSLSSTATQNCVPNL